MAYGKTIQKDRLGNSSSAQIIIAFLCSSIRRKYVDVKALSHSGLVIDGTIKNGLVRSQSLTTYVTKSSYCPAAICTSFFQLQLAFVEKKSNEETSHNQFKFSYIAKLGDG